MNKITVEALINADINKVWSYYTNPEMITKWAFASEDWECPHAENDLRIGGRFLTRMSAKDKSAGFDFTGIYTDVQEHKKIAYKMDKAPEEESNRECEVYFEKVNDDQTKVITIFDAENQNSLELQKAGWQSILDNFKKLVEA